MASPPAPRRPAEGADVDHYVQAWESALAMDGGTEQDALADVIAAVLLDPHFLLRTEIGDEDGVLDNYEIASAIAYPLTDGPPDAELRQAARQGDLHDSEVREAHAYRLAAAHGRASGLRRFLKELIPYQTVINRSNAAFPEFTDSVRRAMREEAERFIQEVIFEERGTVEDLLTADYTRQRRTGDLLRVRRPGIRRSVHQG